MKAAVITFPASNCNRDMQVALQKAGFNTKAVWHQDQLENNFDLIALPGGFSYGDYLRCGAMAAISPIINQIKIAAKKGVKILGVCNGFQILCESGLLDGVLLQNQKGKFICQDVDLQIINKQSNFTKKYNQEIITIPIAHMDGRYFASDDVIKKLQDNDQIAFKYHKNNPNGSKADIAGILNENKNVLGMMPHPERIIEEDINGVDGLKLFESLF